MDRGAPDAFRDESTNRGDATPERKSFWERVGPLTAIGTLILGAGTLALAIVAFLAGQPDPGSTAYRKGAVEACKRVSAIGNTPNGLAVDWASGKLDTAQLEIMFRQHLDKQKGVFDEFLGMKSPAELQGKRNAALESVEAWHTYTRDTLAPRYFGTLPRKATIEQVAGAAASFEAGYRPYAAKVNQSMADLASEPCTAINA